MTETYVEILPRNAGKIPRLNLDLGFKDAVADHLRHRWPCGTAKLAAKAYGISHDRARDAVRGQCSLTTLEQIVKRGGWPVGLAILAAVIGYGISAHFAEMKAQHDENTRRFVALGGGLLSLGIDPDADNSGRPLDRAELGRRLGDRSFDRRRG
ncbi:MAG: hypothetical protein WC718_01565 [Phycisphaerales bacterium]|jgi:hypothetical protein